MTIRSRSEIIRPADTVQLKTLFRDYTGAPADLDAIPTITIIQPSGNVLIAPTTAGVYKIDTGYYGYDLTLGLFSPLGVWVDEWFGELDGYSAFGAFNFVVHNTQMPAINSDGYIHLGDDPGFNYSQTALSNINKIMKAVKARLNSSGLSRMKDEFGNVIYADCDIYTVDQLAVFIATSLTAFNEIPHFTFFTFEDSEIINQFFDVLVQHAVITALSSKALIERGAEFNISDNGATFQPPTISEMLNSQWGTELSNWMEKIKMIKGTMKPGPIGLGTLRPLSASPQLTRLRHLRERRLF